MVFKSNVLDQKIISGLLSLCEQRTYDLLGQLVDIFCTETPQLIEDLQHFLAKNDQESAKKVAHAIKSSSGSIGAMRLQELSGRIEKSNAPLSIEQLLGLVEELKKEYEFAAAELRRLKGTTRE